MFFSHALSRGKLWISRLVKPKKTSFKVDSFIPSRRGRAGRRRPQLLAQIVPNLWLSHLPAAFCKHLFLSVFTISPGVSVPDLSETCRSYWTVKKPTSIGFKMFGFCLIEELSSQNLLNTVQTQRDKGLKTGGGKKQTGRKILWRANFWLAFGKFGNYWPCGTQFQRPWMLTSSTWSHVISQVQVIGQTFFCKADQSDWLSLSVSGKTRLFVLLKAR